MRKLLFVGTGVFLVGMLLGLFAALGDTLTLGRFDAVLLASSGFMGLGTFLMAISLTFDTRKKQELLFEALRAGFYLFFPRAKVNVAFDLNTIESGGIQNTTHLFVTVPYCDSESLRALARAGVSVFADFRMRDPQKIAKVLIPGQEPCRVDLSKMFGGVVEDWQEVCRQALKTIARQPWVYGVLLDS
ncbi:MAG: hypothetical protein ABH814_03180 [bacterium]